jgi:lysophospholipase L1-like esterase
MLALKLNALRLIRKSYRMIQKIWMLSGILLVIAINAKTQTNSVNHGSSTIHPEKNSFVNVSKSKEFRNFFISLHELKNGKLKKLQILQIGDSHTQADFFTEKIRERLQAAYGNDIKSLGLIFPYHVAGTNNPECYRSLSAGTWTTCRNIDKNTPMALGVTGFSLSTSNAASSISLITKNKEYPDYRFDRLKIYHSADSESFAPVIDGFSSKNTHKIDDSTACTTYCFGLMRDSVTLKLGFTNKMQRHFVLHGMIMETEAPGLIVHSAGVNGATASSFLNCKLLIPQIQDIKPDMIVIALGTNDAYGTFNSRHFECTYDSLIHEIKFAAPNKPVLLIIPGDFYNSKKKVNRNISQMKNIIYKLSEKYHCGIWDFQTIMGGEGSIKTWYKNGLAASDRVHLTKQGYSFAGDLFYEAFLNEYNKYDPKMPVRPKDQTPQSTLNHE